MNTTTNAIVEQFFKIAPSLRMERLRTDFYSTDVKKEQQAILNKMVALSMEVQLTILDFTKTEDKEKLINGYQVMTERAHPELKDKDWDGLDKLLVGYVQSGKTELATRIMILLIMYGIKPTFWQQNLNNEVKSMVMKLERNMKNILNDFQMFLEVKGFRVINFPEFKVWDCRNKKSIVDYCNGFGVLVGGLNSTQIRRYMSIPNTKRLKKVHFFDEADKTVYAETKEDLDEDKKCVANDIVSLRKDDNTLYSVEITATPADCFLSDKLQCGQVILMKRPDTHKDFKMGIRPHIINIDMKAKREEGDTYMDFFLKKHLDYLEILNSNSYRIPFNMSGGWQMPLSFLHKTTTKNSEQQEIMDWLVANPMYNQLWAFMLENGKGLKFSHWSVTEPIKIGSNTFLPDDNGVYNLKNVLVEELLGWMFHNGGVERFPRNYIISGRMADRSKSYVYVPPTKANEGKFSKGYWHLTHEYYTVRNVRGAKVSSHSQALRINNTFPDNVEGVLYTLADISADLDKEKVILEASIEYIRNADPVDLVSDVLEPMLININKKTKGKTFAGTKNRKKKRDYIKEYDGIADDKEMIKIVNEGVVLPRKLPRNVGAEETKTRDEDGKIDGVDLGKLRKWLVSKKSVAGNIFRTLYKIGESVSISDLREQSGYTGTEKAFRSNIFNGSKGGLYGQHWIFNNDMVSLNPLIVDYVNNTLFKDLKYKNKFEKMC